MWWHTLVGIGAGLIVAYLILLGLLWLAASRIGDGDRARLWRFR